MKHARECPALRAVARSVLGARNVQFLRLGGVGRAEDLGQAVCVEGIIPLALIRVHLIRPRRKHILNNSTPETKLVAN
jgi:hypothetical protein|eukprot:COSAG06_NODE_3337_length_5489_cov_1.722263_4_plen_78_part_00